MAITLDDILSDKGPRDKSEKSTHWCKLIEQAETFGECSEVFKKFMTTGGTAGDHKNIITAYMNRATKLAALEVKYRQAEIERYNARQMADALRRYRGRIQKNQHANQLPKRDIVRVAETKCFSNINA